MTAAMGGLASSTAVAFSMSRLSLKRADHDKLFAGGIVFASAVMLVRVLVLTALLTHRVSPGLVFIVGVSIAIGCTRRRNSCGARGCADAERKRGSVLGASLSLGAVACQPHQ